jgi:pimeloyl-ACP methyl ester carboxylesterase
MDMKQFALAAALLSLITTQARSQDISGTWQTEKPRYVMKITGSAKSGYRGEWFNLGDKEGMLNGNPLIVARNGNSFTLNPVRTPGTFTGSLSADGKTISGDWGSHDPGQLTFVRATPQTAHPIDPSPHKTSFVTVAPGVKLEVLDWGGNGPPLVFLAGLGRTGHNFDELAPKFTTRHHVYAITRRGYGTSSWPEPTDANFDADRLGDDVVAVLDALHIQKPVLAGHSIAGQELSSIGTRHPEKVTGLIYLDSLFQYAFYNPAQPDLALDSAVVRRDLDNIFEYQNRPSKWRALIAEIQAQLPKLQESLQRTTDMLEGAPDEQTGAPRPAEMTGNKIIANAHRYGIAPVPMLAIMAMPRRCQPNCDKPFMKRIMANDAARLDLFEKQAPNSRVVRLANASHFIWTSNADDVLREMNAFMDGLSR